MTRRPFAIVLAVALLTGGIAAGAFLAGSAAASDPAPSPAAPATAPATTPPPTETPAPATTEAAAPDPNEVYLDEVHRHAAGVYQLEPDRKLIDRGRRICAALDTGATIPVVMALARQAGYEIGLAGILVDASLTAYCPEHVAMPTE